MNPMKATKFILLCVCACLACAQARTFTSKQGDQIEAEFVSLVGSNVTLKGADGKSYTIPIDSFSQKDQDYVRYQFLKGSSDKNPVISLKMREAKGKTTQKPEDMVVVTTWDAGYRVSLENTTALPLENLIVQYGVFKFAAEAAGDKRTSGEIQGGWGQTKVDIIAPRKTFEFETRKLPMRDIKLKSNVVWEGGGKRRNTDDLEGLWVRIYWKDVLILEYKSSANALADQTWSKDLPAPKAAPLN